MGTVVAEEVEKASYVKTRDGEAVVEKSAEAFEDAFTKIGAQFFDGDPVVNNGHLGHISGVAYTDTGAGILPHYCFKREFDGHISIISHEGSRQLRKTLQQAP